MSALWTAAAMGLVGGLHCTAMCGPLVVAGAPRAGAAVRYLVGRLASYALVGAALGHLGRHALCRLPVAWVEGAALVLVVGTAAWRALRLLAPGPSRDRDRPLTIGRKPRSPSLLSTIATFLPRRGLGLGLATGLLPCGLLVPAWALASSTESAPLGAAVMAVLALTTLPGLLVPLVGGPLVARAARRVPAWVQGLAWLAVAVLVAVRPLLVAAHCAH